jgi:hypothetical protein
MHDPMTQAFEIKQFWQKKSEWGYKPPFITVWHVDPEKDGTDDSCGWSRPKLSKNQRERIESIAGDEAREPWYLAYYGKKIESPTEAETLLRQAFLIVGRIFSRQHLCKPAIKEVTFSEASAWACDLLCSPIDNLRGSLCFLPGYHSNSDKDTEYDRKYSAERFFYCVAGYVLRERRPWYRHPRWHIWHWQIQIHPLQNFKRWAFSRCCKCGKGFGWGYSPSSDSWSGTGPLWFRSEANVYHGDCSNPKSSCCVSAVPSKAVE